MTAEIPLKECSAYGQIDRDGGGGQSEENYIYEHPQWLSNYTHYDIGMQFLANCMCMPTAYWQTCQFVT